MSQAAGEIAAVAIRTLSCDASGIRLWPGIALAERRGDIVRVNSAPEVFRAIAILHGPDAANPALFAALDRAARLLTQGHVEKAQKIVQRIALPPVRREGAALLAKFNPSHYGPGPQGGQFAPAGEGGDGGSTARPEPVQVASNPSGIVTDASNQIVQNDSKPWDAHPHAEFRVAIAQAEGSANKPNDGYGETNAVSGALGRYQLTEGALTDAQWMSAQGYWNPSNGVLSAEDFLNNPEAQEDAMTDVMQRNDEQLEAKGVTRYIGQTYQGLNGSITVTQAGLSTAAHRQGATAVATYLSALEQNGWQSGPKVFGVFKDRSDTGPNIETRMRVFQDVPY